MATRLTKTEAAKDDQSLADQAPDADGFLHIGKGKVKFLELDAEKMGDVLASQSASFDAVWICEALSHFPNKGLFFHNAHMLLKQGGKLALADWFKAEGLNDKQFGDDIRPIEGEWVPFPVPVSRTRQVSGWRVRLGAVPGVHRGPSSGGRSGRQDHVHVVNTRSVWYEIEKESRRADEPS